MEIIKNLVTVIAVAFSIAFLDGIFGWELADGFYMVLGFIQIVCIIWLLRLVYKKQ